ncbi:MAG: thioredoxin fold domain-containing protein [candidate division Zixibacteria bacterium]|nr:thioredoxin fold domain-containing protein [candidate division Zixibacteria bacterium]
MDKLTKKSFLLEIFDYETKDEWNYQGKKPCLIDFHDDTCAPCQAVDPILRELSETYSGMIAFYRVDIREEKELTQELGVSNLPTMVLCPMDDKPVVLQGAASKEKIKQAIDNELLKDKSTSGNE